MKRSITVVPVGAILIASGVRPSGQGTADLFDATTLQRVDLWVNSRDWEKLKQDFLENQYYPADLTWRDQTVRNVGIRSRGVASRSGTKPGLRVDFDRYATDQRYLGLKSLVLDNLTQDPSGVHETVSMWLYARMGIPAPREAHARLYVNGEYAGLYAVIEPVDKVLLARVFGSDGDDTLNDGYLYEFDKAGEWNFSYLGPGLDPYKAYFQPKTHDSQPDEELYRPIETIVRLANETPPSELAAAIGPYLDLPGFVRYLAVQNFVAENDGFLGQWGINNFYLYRLEHSNRHVLIRVGRGPRVQRSRPRRLCPRRGQRAGVPRAADPRIPVVIPGDAAGGDGAGRHASGRGRRRDSRSGNPSPARTHGRVDARGHRAAVHGDGVHHGERFDEAVCAGPCPLRAMRSRAPHRRATVLGRSG